jgi:hypothetical protein
MENVRARLAKYFETAGASDHPDEDPRRLILEAAYVDILGRPADDYGTEFLLPRLGSSFTELDLQRELRFSPDGVHRETDVLEGLRRDLHPVLASARECGRSLRDLRVYEVVAVFLVCLGRWPDPGGFENLLRLPSSTPLTSIVRGVERSPEARGRRGRFRPPRVRRLASRAEALAPQLLLLCAMTQLPPAIDLQRDPDPLERRLDHLERTVLMAIRQVQHRGPVGAAERPR